MSVNVKVVGVGGGGSNAVNRMIQTGVAGVEFIGINTDRQVLSRSREKSGSFGRPSFWKLSPATCLDVSLAQHRLPIGAALTKGLGAGGDREIGRGAAEECREEIRQHLNGADIVFVVVGVGGGTGTGAAPVIAEIAREAGALTVGVVTKPFTFEGPRRMRIAEEGLADLLARVDALIAIPNDRLLPSVEKRTALTDAFLSADDILCHGVRSVTDLITTQGLITTDFADIKAMMTEAGVAIMGIGKSQGDHRAIDAAERAAFTPLSGTSIHGARAVLLNITAGPDLMLEEVQQAADVIYRATEVEDVSIIFGAVIDAEMGEELRVTVLAMRFPLDDAFPAFVRQEPRMPRLRPGGNLDFPLPPMEGG